MDGTIGEKAGDLTIDARWIVLRNRDDMPTEATLFVDKNDAYTFYDRQQERWTETFLSKIVYGPRHRRGIPVEKDDLHQALCAFFNMDSNSIFSDIQYENMNRALESLFAFSLLPPTIQEMPI